MKVKATGGNSEGMNKTDIGILAGVGVLLAVEIWTLVNKTPNDTISERINKISLKRPVVPFAMGFLMGHFVWQFAPSDDVTIEHADKVEVS